MPIVEESGIMISLVKVAEIHDYLLITAIITIIITIAHNGLKLTLGSDTPVSLK